MFVFSCPRTDKDQVGEVDGGEIFFLCLQRRATAGTGVATKGSEAMEGDPVLNMPSDRLLFPCGRLRYGLLQKGPCETDYSSLP